MPRKTDKGMGRVARKRGRPRKTEITISQIAAMDPPELRLFRAHMAGYETIETAVGGTTREKYRRIETPFDHARRHGWITEDQHRAAEILCGHFQKGGLLPRVTMSWSTLVDGSKSGDASESRERHARKFRGAIASISEDYRDGFLSWFLEAQADDISVAALGAFFTPMKHYDARKAMGIFVLGKVLTKIADHYGMKG